MERSIAPATPEPDAACSGVRLIRHGMDAFAARVALVRSAKRTLDVQYYIWHADLSGSLLIDELEAAARRGVTVRLLLDDNGIAGLDARLMMLAQAPNIAVRIYNPFRIRRPKAINWLFDFGRLSHRMHAKSLTADARSTIVGGRNVGDEYFGAQSKGLFDDLDVLATGPLAEEILASFARHWDSGHAITAERVLSRVSARKRRALERAAARLETSSRADHYRHAVRDRPLARDLRDGACDFAPAAARTVLNFPTPGGPEDETTGIVDLFPDGLPAPREELIIISGYFVPTAQGTGELARLARSGVRVRVLTNSFASTDVGLVHAGYAPRRAELLAAGVELFEMPAPDDKPRTAGKFVRSGSTGRRMRSGHSLHAKSYVVDGKVVYVGSANFDPRSDALNTELGFLIDSSEVARDVADDFERATRRVYRLGLDGSGALTWIDERDDAPRAETTEPFTNPVSRTMIRLLSHLPIERQL